MKICLIGDASSYHVARWARYFGTTKHDTHCISTGAADIPGVKVHHLRNKYAGSSRRHLFYYEYYLAVRRLIQMLRPDIVHGLQINLYSYLTLRTGARPFVVTPFGGDVLVNPTRSRWARHMARYCLQRSDLITTDAEHIQTTLLSFGAELSRIELIYFATDIDQYQPMPKDAALQNSLGIRGCFCVLSLRHLMPVYNIETLIRSIPLVRAQVPNAKYLIASRGPEEQGLKTLAVSLGVEDCIRWLGFIPGGDLPRYDNLGDIYVSTSLSDAGLAASTGETMACGLPAVITDFGDNAQWVRNGVNGYLFPARDHKVLAEKIVLLAENPTLRAEMGARNRLLIEERYNWSKEMAKMEALYTNLAGHRMAD